MESSKTLICITSCNRLNLVKRYITPYLQLVDRMESYDFMLALDGNNPEYLAFCAEHSIPLIYSDKQEGVGISKNRVLTLFPDFDYYFFIDDDVELVDDTIFERYIDFYLCSNQKYDHLCSTEFFEVVQEEFLCNSTLQSGWKGGGYFNFFTRNGLQKVGGWHTDFAEWKRYGHSEHSYRYVHNGLLKLPFNSILECKNNLIIHSPDHVSSPMNELVDPTTEFFYREQELINNKLLFFPKTILSQPHFQPAVDKNEKKANLLKIDLKIDRYPLSKGKEKRIAKTDFKVFKLHQSKSLLKKSKLLIEILLLNPTNTSFKHWLKQKMGLI